MNNSSESHVNSSASRCVFEIGFDPILKRVYPDQVEFVNTRLRWSDTRAQIASQASAAKTVARALKAFLRALRLASRQRYDVVVTRCLGPVNTFRKPWYVHLAMAMAGVLLEKLVFFASRGRSVRLVVIDQTDHVSVNPRDRRLIERCHLYFKRELAQNHWHSLESVMPERGCIGTARIDPGAVRLRRKLRPISVGFYGDPDERPIPAANKSLDIFYCGNNTEIPLRERLDELLAELARKGWKVYSTRQRLTPEQFHDAIRNSRLSLTVGGAGWDCYRHYEVLAYGSVPIMDFRPIQVVAPLRHGRECFYIDPQDDLVAQIEPWLALAPAQIDRMIAAGAQMLRRHYTADAIGRYVMREIESCMGSIEANRG